MQLLYFARLLHFAAAKSRAATTKTLLALGACSTVKDNTGRTAVDVASSGQAQRHLQAASAMREHYARTRANARVLPACLREAAAVETPLMAMTRQAFEQLDALFRDDEDDVVGETGETSLCLPLTNFLSLQLHQSRPM